jgi:hypothetical protein
MIAWPIYWKGSGATRQSPRCVCYLMPENSSSSSRKRTPRWARLISRGIPAMAAADEGQLRGRMTRIAERPLTHQPPLVEEAGNRTDHADLERASARSSGGDRPGRHAASIDLPAPSGPTISRRCAINDRSSPRSGRPSITPTETASGGEPSFAGATRDRKQNGRGHRPEQKGGGEAQCL